ncbi:DUF397 domain-containing protein [Actinoallomurus sp. NBC_01490]|jgi:hypothetical protein
MKIPSETQLTWAPWRKSSRSGGGQATCVEVAPIETTSAEDDRQV